MSRGAAGETYSVICVARAEFGWDQTKQTHLREVQTDRRTSYNTPDGTACPQGADSDGVVTGHVSSSIRGWAPVPRGHPPDS